MKAACLIPAMLACLTLSADEVRLKDGGRIQGVVRMVDESSVVIETVSGTITIQRTRVESIDREHTSALEEYEGKIAVLGKDPSAEALHGVGAWALENGIKRGKDLLERALLKNPEHEASRRALGFRRYKGAWMTEEEIMLDKGFTRFEGQWVSNSERSLILEERRARLADRMEDVRSRERRIESKEEDLEEREDRIDERERSVESKERRLAEYADRIDTKERRIKSREDKLSWDRINFTTEETRLKIWEQSLTTRHNYLYSVFGDYRRIVGCRSCGIWWPRGKHNSCPTHKRKKKK